MRGTPYNSKHETSTGVTPLYYHNRKLTQCDTPLVILIIRSEVRASTSFLQSSASQKLQVQTSAPSKYANAYHCTHDLSKIYPGCYLLNPRSLQEHSGGYVKNAYHVRSLWYLVEPRHSNLVILTTL